MSDKPVVITYAPLGAGTQRSMNPNVPITPEEVAADCVKCCKAGASIIHIHVRDDNEKGSMEKERFIATTNAVRKALKENDLDMVINITSAGASWIESEDGAHWDNPFTNSDRWASLEELLPEIVTFDCGSLNWANNRVMINSPAFLTELGAKAIELNIKPEIEIFDVGQINSAKWFIEKGVLQAPAHFQFIMGTPAGLDGTTENLANVVSKLPEGSTWSVTGIGKAHMPMILAGLSLGADGIRVGLEDNLYYSRGQLATNEQLVARAAKLVELSGRRVATAEEAREILHLTKKV